MESASCWHVTNTIIVLWSLGNHWHVQMYCICSVLYISLYIFKVESTHKSDSFHAAGSAHSNAGLSWRLQILLILILLCLEKNTLKQIFLSLSLYSSLPLAFMADLSSLLCLCALRGSPLHSAITLTLLTLVLRSGSIGEPSALCSEPDGVLEGDTDWLVGQPVSSIVNRHTDSNSQEQAAQGRQRRRQSVKAQGSAWVLSDR